MKKLIIPFLLIIVFLAGCSNVDNKIIVDTIEEKTGYILTGYINDNETIKLDYKNYITGTYNHYYISGTELVADRFSLDMPDWMYTINWNARREPNTIKRINSYDKEQKNPINIYLLDDFLIDEESELKKCTHREEMNKKESESYAEHVKGTEEYDNLTPYLDYETTVFEKNNKKIYVTYKPYYWNGEIGNNVEVCFVFGDDVYEISLNGYSIDYANEIVDNLKFN